MAPVHPVADLESDYASSEDSDFAPDEAAAEAAAAATDADDADDADDDSGSEAEDSVDELGVDYVSPQKRGKRTPGRRKKPDEQHEAEEVGFANSGDEAIIGKGLKGRRRRRRAGKSAARRGGGDGDEDGDEDDHGDEDEEEDGEEGGQGGYVRTRAMRAAEGPLSKRALASTEAATVNVDELWEQMMAEPFKQVPAAAPAPPPPPPQGDADAAMDIDSPDMALLDAEDMVMIDRTYTFAGKVHAESKLVPRHSAEAQLWLKSQPLSSVAKNTPTLATLSGSTSTTAATVDATTTTKPLRRPMARRSVYEPAADLTSLARTDLRFKAATYRGPSITEQLAAALQAKDKARKLTTVEKSKMDWAGYVDQEGLKEDLEKAGKRKGAYLDDQEFLARAEGRREEEGRRARGVVV